MKHKIDLDKLNFLQATLIILGVLLTMLFLWLTAIWATASISQKSTNNLESIATLLAKPWYILLLYFFALILLSLILTFLFSLKFIKKRKKSKLKQPLKIYTSKSFPKLPPIEEMKKMFKLNQINREILRNKFNYSNIKTKHYMELFEDAGFLEDYKAIFFYQHPFSNDRYFMFSKIGRQYAIDNNLD